MKLIIDIDEDLKSAIYNCGLFLNPTDKITLINAINNGTPLPKGHGRLIDADRLKTHFVGTEQGTDLEVYLEPTIINAPTIIEAESEETK